MQQPGTTVRFAREQARQRSKVPGVQLCHIAKSADMVASACVGMLKPVSCRTIKMADLSYLGRGQEWDALV